MDERKPSVDSIPSPYPLPPEGEGNPFQGQKRYGEQKQKGMEMTSLKRPRFVTHSFIARYLDPTEILNETLFGIIMVLTFTLGADLLVEEGANATRQLLLGILGCNIAWGIIDGAIYVMNAMADRSRKGRLIRSILGVDDGQALALVRKSLDPTLASFASESDRDRLYQDVLGNLRKSPPGQTRVTPDDFCGAVAVFWLVFLSTLPAVLPFVLIQDRFTALRVSNILLLVSLFLVGYRWARVTQSNPWVVGSLLFVGGLGLVAVAMLLGG
jgi:hypothetical protein